VLVCVRVRVRVRVRVCMRDCECFLKYICLVIVIWCVGELN